ncbi:hypothetical protein [Legionella fairfieldensis]|uniref:hypothetical protein n=1 Tax=Legionella fairfieldensis TaxID=45064 RepID=UPI00048DF347|nr:hypothetical protein [Legionella fairfieldensis]
MYHKKTVFILGAGASCYYGYPLGKQLIPKLLESLDDTIPIPTIRSDKQHVFYNETDRQRGILYDFDLIRNYLVGHTEFHERENYYSPYAAVID